MVSAERRPAGSGRAVEVEHRNFLIRLAETPEEVAQSQRLRYRVFIEQMGATPTPEMVERGLEFDQFDPHCDHLVVFDRSRGDDPGEVVATYRFLRRAGAARAGGFYTATEYDIAPLIAYPGEILELGRSCVEPAYRNSPVMQFVWRGIAAYVLHHDITLMFGCASLHGTSVEKLALPLSYLHHRHLAPEDLRPRALADRYTSMDLMPAEAIDEKAAHAALPPLVKGYLRLGGFVGDGAVVDRDFGTTDVCIVVKTDLVSGKYRRNLTRGYASADEAERQSPEG